MIEAMFNPDPITYTKANNWTYHPTNGQSLPPGAFANGRPATLVVTLMFDGTEEGANVAKTVNKLTKLTKVDENLDNGTVAGARLECRGFAVAAASAAEGELHVGQLPLVRRGHPEGHRQVQSVPRRRNAGPGRRSR